MNDAFSETCARTHRKEHSASRMVENDEHLIQIDAKDSVQFKTNVIRCMHTQAADFFQSNFLASFMTSQLVSKRPQLLGSNRSGRRINIEYSRSSEVGYNRMPDRRERERK